MGQGVGGGAVSLRFNVHRRRRRSMKTPESEGCVRGVYLVSVRGVPRCVRNV